MWQKHERRSAALRVSLFGSCHIWRHLWTITEQTRNTMESICSNNWRETRCQKLVSCLLIVGNLSLASELLNWLFFSHMRKKNNYAKVNWLYFRDTYFLLLYRYLHVWNIKLLLYILFSAFQRLFPYHHGLRISKIQFRSFRVFHRYHLNLNLSPFVTTLLLNFLIDSILFQGQLSPSRGAVHLDGLFD